MSIKLDERFSCPVCKKVLNAATSVGEPDARPSVGDLSACLYCGTLLAFEETHMRHATPEEVDEIDKSLLRQLNRIHLAWVERHENT